MITKQEFVNDFFTRLEEADVRYCVLRNWEGLESESENEEVDIMVDESDFPTLRKIVEDHPHCMETGRIVDTTHPFLVRAVGEDFILKLDFQWRGIGFCGAYMLPADTILDNRERHGDLYITPEPYYFLELFTHSVFYHGAFRKYTDVLPPLADDPEVETVFKEFYGEEQGARFLEWTRRKEYDRILQHRNRLMLTFLLRHPQQSIDVLLSLIYRAGNKYGVWSLLHTLNPFRTAPLIAFMGVDKSGKSTLSRFAVEELERHGQDAVLLNGGVFKQYPPFTWANRARKWLITRRTEEGDGTVGETYDEKVTSPGTTGPMAMIYRILNSVITHLAIFTHRQRGHWVVTDRYTWDLTFFMGAPPFWERLTRLLFPDPDLPFHITVSNDTLQDRDCELAPASVTRIKNRINERTEQYGLIDVENEDLETAKDTVRNHLRPLVTGRNTR